MASHPITITLPWPAPALNPNSRVHFIKLAKFKKKAKADAIWATCAAVPVGDRKLGPGGQLKVTILAYPPTLRNRDDDNLIASLKAAFDGVAFALGVDDSRFRRPTIEWGEVRRGGDLVLVISPISSATGLSPTVGAGGDVSTAHDPGAGPDPDAGDEWLSGASPNLQPGRA
jgi:crossover junction endodeoxyribonuclease RusA